MIALSCGSRYDVLDTRNLKTSIGSQDHSTHIRRSQLRKMLSSCERHIVSPFPNRAPRIGGTSACLRYSPETDAVVVMPPLIPLRFEEICYVKIRSPAWSLAPVISYGMLKVRKAWRWASADDGNAIRRWERRGLLGSPLRL